MPARHLTDTALGTAGAAPQSIRQARAAAIEAADHLEACLAAGDALKAETTANNDWSALRVQDAAVAVLRAEMAGRGVAMAARISQLQRDLVAAGSGLEWLSRAGAFRVERGVDSDIRHTVWRMDSAPNRWATLAERPGAEPFAPPLGAQRWQAAFEQLKLDATAPLPDDPT